MKHQILSFLAAGAAVLLGTAACTNIKEKEFDPNDPAVFTIAATPETQSVIAEGGDLVYTFDAPGHWFVSSPVDWLEFEPESGKAGPVSIKVTVKQNVSKERSALVTVTSKYDRGRFTVNQEAWPYSHEWTMFGTIGGAEAAQDYAMEDLGDQLEWKASKVPFHFGETFKFRMNGGDAVSLGLSGALAPIEGQDNTYTGSLVKGGDEIALPFEAFWDVALDLNNWTITATLAERYPWTYIGTVNDSNWDQDFEMTDKGDQLVWEATWVPFWLGEELLFRMDKNDAYSTGLAGAFEPVEGIANTYVASLKQGGDPVALPDYGYWNLTLDLNEGTLTVGLAQRFPWTYIGSIDGSNWDKDFTMTDMGKQLVWQAQDVPFHFGDEFRFRMGGKDVVNLGVDGGFSLIEGENTYEASLKQDGGNISLPAEGWWSLTLDVEKKTLTAVLTKEFPRVFPGLFWENDGSAGAISWSSTYRFGLDGRDPNKECLTTFPAEVWDRIKTETFYLVVRGENPQIRVTTGWWDPTWGPDYQPGNELLTDNGDGTWTLKINLSDSPDFCSAIDQRHLLFTGDRYTPIGLYPEVAWENDGSVGAISWSSNYRFGMDGRDGGNECLLTFPEPVWNKLKTGTFYLDMEATNPQIRVVTGWWGDQWLGDDIYPGNERLKDNGDGTFTLTVDLAGHPIINSMDQQHLLFTGDRYTPLRIRIKW